MTVAPVRSSSAWSVAERVDVPVRATSADLSVAASSRDLRQADFRPLDNRSAAWLPDVIGRINYLISDFGQAFAPRPLQALVRVLADSIWDGTPAPMVAPAGEGGIAVEFRGPSVELQIEVDSDGSATAYAVQRGISEWEGPFSDLPDGVAKWAWRLAQDSL